MKWTKFIQPEEVWPYLIGILTGGLLGFCLGAALEAGWP